jgi:DedD protein
MALLDNGLKQRMVGALVLLALAVIFLPMLFSRQDEAPNLVVDAPAMPVAPAPVFAELEPVIVPEPLLFEEPEPEPESIEVAPAPAQPVVSAPAPVAQPAPAPVKRLDGNNLPISWSVQLASLSSRPGAETLQKTLRSQGYNAYIRTVDGMNRVFVGPLIERAEADRLRDQLNRQHKLNGFVVRFQPEAG